MRRGNIDTKSSANLYLNIFCIVLSSLVRWFVEHLADAGSSNTFFILIYVQPKPCSFSDSRTNCDLLPLPILPGTHQCSSGRCEMDDDVLQQCFKIAFWNSDLKRIKMGEWEKKILLNSLVVWMCRREHWCWYGVCVCVSVSIGAMGGGKSCILRMGKLFKKF